MSFANIMNETAGKRRKERRARVSNETGLYRGKREEDRNRKRKSEAMRKMYNGVLTVNVLGNVSEQGWILQLQRKTAVTLGSPPRGGSVLMQLERKRRRPPLPRRHSGNGKRGKKMTCHKQKQSTNHDRQSRPDAWSGA